MSRSALATTGATLPSRTTLPEACCQGGSKAWIPALYTGTLFVSAGLLFCVQPMVAREVLPSLGGSPAVWNTCMVFFQAALLAGYSYAHLLSTRFRLPTQTIAHSG